MTVIDIYLQDNVVLLQKGFVWLYPKVDRMFA